MTGEWWWKEWQRGWARKSYGGEEVEGNMVGQMAGVKRMTEGSYRVMKGSERKTQLCKYYYTGALGHGWSGLQFQRTQCLLTYESRTPSPNSKYGDDGDDYQVLQAMLA